MPYFAAERDCSFSCWPAKAIVEASDLGIPPGEIPRLIETDIGNGGPFVWVRTGDDFTQIYKQYCGVAELHVIND